MVRSSPSLKRKCWAGFFLKIFFITTSVVSPIVSAQQSPGIDLPSCERAHCTHCNVAFIARVCPIACSRCLGTSNNLQARAQQARGAPVRAVNPHTAPQFYSAAAAAGRPQVLLPPGYPQQQYHRGGATPVSVPYALPYQQQAPAQSQSSVLTPQNVQYYQQPYSLGVPPGYPQPAPPHASSGQFIPPMPQFLPAPGFGGAQRQPPPFFPQQQQPTPSFASLFQPFSTIPPSHYYSIPPSYVYATSAAPPIVQQQQQQSNYPPPSPTKPLAGYQQRPVALQREASQPRPSHHHHKKNHTRGHKKQHHHHQPTRHSSTHNHVAKEQRPVVRPQPLTAVLRPTSIDGAVQTVPKIVVDEKYPIASASTTCPRQPNWEPCITKELANERYQTCCQHLGPGCLALCTYDATLTTIQLAVLTGRCPLSKVADVMICASGHEDATGCCEAYGVFEPGYQHCRPYCNPAAGLPQNGLLSEQYKCLGKLSQIQRCFYVTQRAS